MTPREHYDRAFRMKRSIQASIVHEDLPKEQWIKPEEVCSLPSCLPSPAQVGSPGRPLPQAPCPGGREGGQGAPCLGHHGCCEEAVDVSISMASSRTAYYAPLIQLILSEPPSRRQLADPTSTNRIKRIFRGHGHGLESSTAKLLYNRRNTCEYTAFYLFIPKPQ